MVTNILKNLVWFAFTGIVSLLLLEFSVRAFRLIPDTVPIPYRAMPGAETIASIPNTEARSILGVVSRVNSLGLRGVERAAEKPVGMTRVVVLGDSVTWGQGVDAEKGFVNQLGVLLNERRGPYEVWNSGVVGTNIHNHKARYARLAPILRPDATVVVLLYNDLRPEADRFRVTPLGKLSLPHRQAPFPDSWRPTLEKIALYWVSLGIYSRLIEERLDESSMIYIEAMEFQLDKIVAIAGSVNSMIVLASMPGRWPPATEYDTFASALAAYASRNGVPFIGLDLVLGNPVPSALLLPSDSVHPNAAGHKLIAEALAPLIL